MTLGLLFGGRLRRHWWVLGLCMVLPVAAVSIYVGQLTRTYSSQAQVTASDVRLGTDLAGFVRSVVTSDAALARASAAAGVRRSARPSVVGKAPTVSIVTADPDPRAAQAITNSLAVHAVEVINSTKHKAIRAEITELRKKLDPLVKKRKRLRIQAQSFPGVPRYAADLEAVNASVVPLQRQLKARRAEAKNVRDGRVKSAASLPGEPDPVPLDRPGLVLLIGLLAGLAISMGREVVSPSVPGARRVAERLGGPLIGILRGRGASPADLGRKLRLAARHNKVDTIVLSGVKGPVPGDVVVALQEFVWTPQPAAPVDEAPTQAFPIVTGEHLSTKMSSWNPGPAHHPRPTSDDPGRVRVVTIEALDPAIEERPTGMVVIAPPVSKKQQVQTVADLAEMSGWPLLGVVGDSGHGRLRVR